MNAGNGMAMEMVNATIQHDKMTLVPSVYVLRQSPSHSSTLVCDCHSQVPIIILSVYVCLHVMCMIVLSFQITP